MLIKLSKIYLKLNSKNNKKFRTKAFKLFENRKINLKVWIKIKKTKNLLKIHNKKDLKKSAKK